MICAASARPRILLLAGGVGITPIMAMVRDLTDRSWPGQLHLVFSVRTAADIIYADELAYLARRFPNLHLCIVVTRGDDTWAGHRGHVTGALLRREVPNLARTPVYLCGPEPMMAAMQAILIEEGVPAGAIHTEAFTTPAVADLAAGRPGGAAGGPALAAADHPVAIRFTRAGLDGEVGVGQTILEAAEDCGVALPFECRSGVCGQCKTRVVSGRVAMADGLALTAAERARGLVLACQARPVEDLVVEA